MNKRNKAVTALIVAVLFVSAITGTVFYYDGKIANLKGQISKLNDFIANLPAAHSEASLETIEMLGNESNEMGTPTPIPYNYLYINGLVNNTGKGTAYNAGLLVVAYDAAGTLEVNLTVPLRGGIFGSDNATNTFVLEKYGIYDPRLGTYIGGSSRTLGVLDGLQTTYIGSISILHEGTVTSWTVTPVWTNSP